MAIAASTSAEFQPSYFRTQLSAGTAQTARTSGAWTNQSRP